MNRIIAPLTALALLLSTLPVVAATIHMPAGASIGSYVDQLKPGDTLIVPAGTYPEQLRGIPSGTSWDQPVTIAGAPGATVILKPTSGDGALADFSGNHYIVLRNLTLDAADFARDGTQNVLKVQDNADHIRVENSKLLNARGFTEPSATKGALLIGCCNEFVNDEVAGNLGYGMYISSANNLVEGSNIHDNNRYGLHIYSDNGGVDNNIIRNNQITNNGNNSAGCWGGCQHPGVVISSGSGNQFYGNTVMGNAAGGIQVSGGQDVHDNIIADNNGPCFVDQSYDGNQCDGVGNVTMTPPASGGSSAPPASSPPPVSGGTPSMAMLPPPRNLRVVPQSGALAPQQAKGN